MLNIVNAARVSARRAVRAVAPLHGRTASAAAAAANIIPASAAGAEGSARSRAAAFVLAAMGAGAALWATSPDATGLSCKGKSTITLTPPEDVPNEESNTPPPRPDLPTYRLSDLRAHSGPEEGCWVSFRGAVYDITGFLYGHPGGTGRLLMASGNDLEPYWDVYRQHYRGHVIQWMEKLRIGSLHPDDQQEAKNFHFPDMFETDPERNPDLLGTTKKPWCGEPYLPRLVENYLTPNDLFYVRNHLAVPVIEEDEYRLEVKGIGVTSHTFTLEDLKTKFPKYEVVSTLQCAGNRREDFQDEERQIFISPHWISGAISNAKWGGCRLRDVLEYCGMDVDGMALGRVRVPGAEHVQFEGYDQDETGMTYGGSIPMDKAVDALGDCLIAYEMNGEELPRDHGYPVRALAPGHAGARQCKWLNKVIVATEESDRPWHQKSYRGFAPDVTFEDDLHHWPHGLRLDLAPIVQEMPVQSLVCQPAINDVIGVGKDADEVEVKGVAWSGGGRGINRVDVSIDGGETFTAAELVKPVQQIRNRQWGWYHFNKKVKLPEDIKRKLRAGKPVTLDVTSKALNGDWNAQPERPEPYYNSRGVCINHWYHVPVTLDPNTSGVKHEPTHRNVPTGGEFRYTYRDHGWTGKPSEAGKRSRRSSRGRRHRN